VRTAIATNEGSEGGGPSRTLLELDSLDRCRRERNRWPAESRTSRGRRMTPVELLEGGGVFACGH
jgi:hypothetical protein